MAVPYIYLAFANSDTEVFLKSIDIERNEIRNRLAMFDSRGLLKFGVFDNLRKEDLEETLPEYTQHVQIFHYGGHAGEDESTNTFKLALKNINYSEDEFARMIGNFPNLKLVFLNGCSTKGMVARLHQAGVKAVLATSAKINDAKAAKFAIKFYRYLTIEGHTLHTAFDQAASTLGEEAAQEVTVRFMKGAVDPESNEVMPWGLYFKSSEDPAKDKLLKEEILSWQLLGAADQLISGELRDMLLEYEAELDKSEERKKKIYKSLKRNKRLLGFEEEEDEPDQESIQELKDDILALENELKEIDAKLEGMRIKIASQSLEDNNSKIRAELLRKLEGINYKDQVSKFRRFSNTQIPTQAFIVQGTPACGHEILLQRYLGLLGIKSKNIYTRIDIPFQVTSSITASATSIWAKVQMAMKNLENFRHFDSDKPERIVEMIIERYKAPNHIVFVFKDVYEKTDKNMAVFKEFWSEFLRIFSEKTKNLSQKTDKFWVLLFLMDQTCLYHQGQIKSKEDKYKGLIQQQLTANFPHLIPTIGLVDGGVLSDWVDNRDVPQPILTQLGDLDRFPGPLPGLRVLFAIHKICQVTQNKKVYDDLVIKYSIDYEVTDSDQQTEEFEL